MYSQKIYEVCSETNKNEAKFSSLGMAVKK
jgi:hypothetical protein